MVRYRSARQLQGRPAGSPLLHRAAREALSGKKALSWQWTSPSSARDCTASARYAGGRPSDSRMTRPRGGQWVVNRRAAGWGFNRLLGGGRSSSWPLALPGCDVLILSRDEIRTSMWSRPDRSLPRALSVERSARGQWRLAGPPCHGGVDVDTSTIGVSPMSAVSATLGLGLSMGYREEGTGGPWARANWRSDCLHG